MAVRVHLPLFIYVSSRYKHYDIVHTSMERKKERRNTRRRKERRREHEEKQAAGNQRIKDNILEKYISMQRIRRIRRKKGEIKQR